MLKHALAEMKAQNSNKQLGINPYTILNDKLSGIETTSIFSLSSLLDPRFKMSDSKALQMPSQLCTG